MQRLLVSAPSGTASVGTCRKGSDPTCLDCDALPTGVFVADDLGELPRTEGTVGIPDCSALLGGGSCGCVTSPSLLQYWLACGRRLGRLAGDRMPVRESSVYVIPARTSRSGLTGGSARPTGPRSGRRPSRGGPACSGRAVPEGQGFSRPGRQRKMTSHGARPWLTPRSIRTA